MVGLDRSATRKVLLDTAEIMMVEEGYAAVTSRRLGARAGVKPQLVHYYFPSMDDLFVALFRRIGERRIDHAAKSLESGNPLRTLWQHSSDSTEVVLNQEFMALANHRKAIRAEIAQCGEQYRKIQLDALNRFFKEHGVTPEMPAGVATFLISAIGTLKVLEETVGISFAHAEMTQVVEAALKKFEAGLKAQAKSASARKTGTNAASTPKAGRLKNDDTDKAPGAKLKKAIFGDRQKKA
jgi:AcrR family transcriptional regulator